MTSVVRAAARWLSAAVALRRVNGKVAGKNVAAPRPAVLVLAIRVDALSDRW